MAINVPSICPLFKPRLVRASASSRSLIVNARFLEQTIQGVLDQAYLNLECIIVDCGSNENL